MNFLDLEAIASADRAFENKQYNVSTMLYRMAHKKLMKYNGDRMLPIQMAGDVKNKLQRSEMIWTKNPQQTPLTYRTWSLSKTSYVAGKQCLKHLYLDKYKRNERSAPSPATKILWEKGREFENLVRKRMFPNGIDVKDAMASKFNYFSSYTDSALKHFREITLFEASFIEDKILVMVDMLHKDEKGELDLYEIKLHTELTEGILWDLSIQYHVVKKRFGEKIKSFNVVLRRGEEDFEFINVKEDLEKLQEETGNQGFEFIHFLQISSEPDIAMGPHCYLLYSCGFKDYCTRVATLPDYHV